MTTHKYLFAPKLIRCWSTMHVVSLITRWPLNLNGPLSLFLMSLALRLLFLQDIYRGSYFSLSSWSWILAAIKHRLEWWWTCSCLMHWLEGVIIFCVRYQAGAEIAGDLELGIYGHLCQALDPTDKTVCLAAVRCENSVSKRVTLPSPPMSCEPGPVFIPGERT